jgi:hypothetical protein
VGEVHLASPPSPSFPRLRDVEQGEFPAKVALSVTIFQALGRIPALTMRGTGWVSRTWALFLLGSSGAHLAGARAGVHLSRFWLSLKGPHLLGWAWGVQPSRKGLGHQGISNPGIPLPLGLLLAGWPSVTLKLWSREAALGKPKKKANSQLSPRFPKRNF